MSKLEYLDALRRALAGLPPQAAARTMAYYEQRFIDGLAGGRSEAQIAAELDDPKKIALTLRASTHLHSFEQKKTPVKLLRMLISAIGLLVFNLFMVVPALVYSALLMALFATALAFYIGGIAITASGLSGANELVLDGPFRQLLSDWDGDNDSSMQTRILIEGNAINIFQEPKAANRADTDKPESGADADASGDEDNHEEPGVIRKAEALAGHGLHISTDMEHGSRTTQALFGLGMLIGGIAMFLVGLVVTKYTLVGIKRYVEMNFSLLRGG
ncbi:MAG TPA: DUF1700 domain-containing protein [Janthinobacterium sp.]|jgi:uncharacterized membrane protein|nr:DUF1700 domain-containing protein [Janthinobacterium sp.]